MSFSKDSVGNKPREQIVEEQMLVFGVDRLTAEFIASMELGEVSGDIIRADERDNEQPQASARGTDN